MLMPMIAAQTITHSARELSHYPTRIFSPSIKFKFVSKSSPLFLELNIVLHMLKQNWLVAVHLLHLFPHLLAVKDLLEFKELKEYKDLLVPLDPKELKDPQESQEFKDPEELQELLVPLDQTENLVPLDHLDL